MSKMDGLLPRLKDELLEFHVGDDYEEIHMADTTKKISGVIYGILRDIVDEFLVVDSFYLDRNGALVSGNIIYINTWAIKMFTKVKYNGCLNDVLLSRAHTRKIKELLGISDD